MNEIILSYVNYLICIPAFLFCWYAFKRIMKYVEGKENLKLVKDFDLYHAILTFHMESAYETIHKDNILVYSLEGVKPKEQDIDMLSRDFVKLTRTLLGPNMLSALIDLYGGEDSLYTIMLFYFDSKFENDEIRSSAITNIQNGEEI
jgi:hypothetical protein